LPIWGEGVSDDLILGIDGGGSKVLVALADRSGPYPANVPVGAASTHGQSGWLQELERHLQPFPQRKEI
jgi:glucosamine kinase